MLRFLITRSDGVKRRLDFEKDDVTLGRADLNDIALPHGRVSKRHATIAFDADLSAFVLTDLESTNGTKLNGKKVSGSVPLANKDVIEIGAFTLDLRLRLPAAGSKRAAPPVKPKPRAPPKKAAAASIDAELAEILGEDTINDNDLAGLAKPRRPREAAPARAPSRDRPSPGMVAAIECLEKYVAIDEELREEATGKACHCGSCLLCEAKRALAAQA